MSPTIVPIGKPKRAKATPVPRSGRFSLPLETINTLQGVKEFTPLDEADARLPRNPRPLSLRQESTMPSIVSLPTRAGSIEFEDEAVAEVSNLLEEASNGQGVAIEDNGQDTEPKARNRAKIMRDLLVRDHAWSADTLRTHVVNTGTNKAPNFLPVLSVKKSAQS